MIVPPAPPVETACARQQALQPAESVAHDKHLRHAATFLEQGDDKAAIAKLTQYLALHPEHWQVRAQRAESLLRLDQTIQARRDFEQAVAHIQESGPHTTRALIHCHRRLLEIARRQADEYAERLERGIALHWLACERSLLADAEGDCSREGLLFKSLSELMAAHVLRPQEARPCWYLSVVWSKLEQPEPATRWRRLAQAAAPFTYMTPAEQRNLQFARPCVLTARRSHVGTFP